MVSRIMQARRDSGLGKKRSVWPVFLSCLFGVSEICTGSGPDGRVYTDPIGDTRLKSYDLVSVSVRHPASNALRFRIHTAAAAERAPREGAAFRIFMDIDRNAETGDQFVAGTGIDLYLLLVRRHGRWEATAARRSVACGDYTFSFPRTKVAGDEVIIEIQSLSFKKMNSMAFFVESCSQNERLSDRLPNEGFFVWNAGERRRTK